MSICSGTVSDASLSGTAPNQSLFGRAYNGTLFFFNSPSHSMQIGMRCSPFVGAWADSSVIMSPSFNIILGWITVGWRWWELGICTKGVRVVLHALLSLAQMPQTWVSKASFDVAWTKWSIAAFHSSTEGTEKNMFAVT